jgi:predicted amidohydrolase YtcJ
MQADLALVNGHIVTIDGSRAPSEAVAVQGGRIIAVGPDTQVRAAIGPNTEVVDLSGRTVLPGFQDAHVHTCKAGVELRRCNLFDLPPDPSHYLDAVADYANRHRDAEWIVGKGWSMDAFPAGIPHRSQLDAVLPDRPVFLVNRDGHGAWVNTAALDRAGISASTADPPHGRIERDAAGEPVGMLQEGAMELVARFLPPVTTDTIKAGILAGQGYLLSLGVTAWQDAWVGQQEHDAYVGLDAEGKLIGRVVGAQWWDRTRNADQIGELEARRAQARHGRYRATSVKIMQDGVCENHTAAMLRPYRKVGGSGLSFFEPTALNRYVTTLDARGFQVHFHALGDRAVRECLDAVEAARLANGPSAGRHHLAHLQVVDPADRPRFRELDVVANAQPLWAYHDATQAELTIPFLGEARAARQYAWRSLLDAGARLAFGSDWDVSTPNPFEGIHVAVTRTHPAGSSRVFYPSERLTLREALVAATAGSAYVNGLDDVTGAIRPGMLADLVVTDRPLNDATDLHEVTVDMTLVDGTVVHER